MPGVDLEFVSRNPLNYRQAIVEPELAPEVPAYGMLFRATSEPAPAVIVVPGSLGVAPSHVAHADRLLGEGFTVLVLDPFGPRSVTSTVENQTHYSFAASAYDVLAAYAMLADVPEIDENRISAQGHSRGGSAVLTAAMRGFADPIVGTGRGLRAVYAAYPWCGHQFAAPDVGNTRIRAIVGDQDDWVSVQQVQALVAGVAGRDGDATARVVVGAPHSFDRDVEPHELPEARIAPAAPTIYLATDGSMIDPESGEARPEWTDLDVFLAAAAQGHGRTGAHIGSYSGQPELFVEDMLSFHRSNLAAP